MKIPDSITKRDLLHGARKASPADILTLGEMYYSGGQCSDAIDFFARAEAKDRLAAVAQELINQGDTFLLLKVVRLVGNISDAQILECAQRAEALGKIRYAILAYEKLGDESKAESLRDSISEDGDIVALREAETFVAPHQEEIQGEEDA